MYECEGVRFDVDPVRATSEAEKRRDDSMWVRREDINSSRYEEEYKPRSKPITLTLAESCKTIRLTFMIHRSICTNVSLDATLQTANI